MCLTDLYVAQALVRERLRSVSRSSSRRSPDAEGAGDTSSSSSSTSAQAPTSTSTTTGSTTQSGAGGPRTKPVSPPDRVRTAVEAVLTSDDPADACGRYVTSTI